QPAAGGPPPGRGGERPASDREERGSADIREEPRPIANKRLDRIGDPIRPVRNHGSVRAGASCPAGDQESAPDGPASRLEEAPRSARCTPSALAHRCSWRLPPCGDEGRPCPRL